MPPVFRHKLPLALLCAWCLALLVARAAYAGDVKFAFLAWNLLLATVPVFAGLLLRALSLRRGLVVAKAAIFVMWLAFLPNAPYLVTDFVYLESRPPVPLWFDLAMLASFAATGVVLCYSSVADVEAAVAERFGRWPGVTVALGSLALSGFGIYLGRYQRLNSWDLLLAPREIVRQLAGGLLDPLANPRAWGVSAVYGLALVLGYIALQGLARSLPPHEGAR